MRLGAPVYGCNNASEWVEAHFEKGYKAAYWPLRDDAPIATVNEYLRAAGDNDIVIAEVGIWNNMLDPDAEKRRQNFDASVKRLETAEYVGARCCVNISGSRSNIWDGPHPLNLTKETYDMVVETTQRLIDKVNPQNTCFTLEPMPWMYPHDEADVLNLIRDIDRKAFAAHVDMVNLVNSYDKYIATGALTDRFFKALAPYIRSVHMKDTKIIPDRLTLHIDEALPGEGEFDYQTLLKNCAALHEDLPMMIEHLSKPEEYDRAAANIRRTAAEMGLSFK